MFKKIVSGAIITAMLFVMFNVSLACAQNIENNEAKDFLSVLGIVSENSANMESEISREEFAFMLAKALKLDKSGSSDVRYFRDVENDSYAVSAINALASNQVISVPEDRKFRPEAAILFEEACKMIVCAMDYELIAQSKGGYPIGYVVTAMSMDIEGNNIGDALSYSDAYTMLFNAMLANLPKVDSVDGNGNVLYSADHDESILTEYWDIYTAEGTLEALCGMSMKGSLTDEKNKAIVGGKSYQYSDKVKLDSLFGGYVEIFYQKTANDTQGCIVFARKTSVKEDIVIQPEEITDANLKEITYYKDNSHKKVIKLKSTRVIYNGKPLENNVRERLTNINKGSVTIKDSDDDGHYDLVLVKDYRNFLVSTITEEKIFNRLKTGDVLTLDEYESVRVLSGESETELASVATGNILSVAQSVDGKFVEIVISKNELEGTISQIGTEAGIWYLTINETTYPVEKTYAVSLFGEQGQKQTSLLLGRQCNVKLDNFGNIAHLETITSDMKTGVVIKGGLFDKSFSEMVRFLILTQDGVFEDLELAERVSVNGEKQTDGGKEFLDEFLSSSDKLIRYTLNDEGKINAVVTVIYDNNAEYEGVNVRAIYPDISQQWYNSARLGTAALMTKNTPIFMIPYGNRNPNEEDCAVMTYSSLIDNVNHYSNAYHYNAESVAADAAVLYYEYGNLYDNIAMYRPVIMFSCINKRLNENMMPENVLVGYTKGGRVEYIVPDSISFKGIEEGDMIMLNHGLAGKVVEGEKLSANDIEIVCKVSDIKTNKKPTWTKNTHHDYLYANSDTAINDYYRADFQMSFGYVNKVSGTQVAWGYKDGNAFSEAANITGNIVIYDASRKKGDRVVVGNTTDLVTYGAAGYDCSKIIFRTRGGRIWETFCYNE